MSVVVVGGGLAGLAAAARLAEEGLRPHLLEARKGLGGRASALTDLVTGLRVDNGQHILMGCNRSVRAFLERVGAADALWWQPRLELDLASKSHGRLRLRIPPLPGSLAAMAGLLTTRGLRWGERIGAASALAAFLSGGAGLRMKTVSEVLDGLATPPAARAHFLDPLVVATLNDDPRRASAEALEAVAREAFAAGVKGSALGLPRRDLESAFAEPARRFIEGLGGRVETQRPAEAVLAEKGRVEGLRLEGGEVLRARAVVVAVPPWSLASLVPLGTVPEGLEELPTSPIVSATLWLDRPVMEEPLIALVGTTAQWAFNRTRLLGLKGPGQVIAITVSAADETVGAPKAEIVETFLEDLRSLLPRAREARLEHWVVVKERRATVPWRPAHMEVRPKARSPLGGLYLAGGWMAPGLPDTLEAAARSGEEAAEALLADGAAS